MKIKINWKELGKQLWDAVRCAAESEAFGGKPRRLRSNRAHERSEVAPRRRALIWLKSRCKRDACAGMKAGID
jgi:phage gp16-like protein